MEKEITQLKVNYATMAEKIDNLCEKVDNIDVKLTTYIAHERAREIDMRNNFAGKWTEPLVIAILISIVGLVIKTMFGI